MIDLAKGRMCVTLLTAGVNGLDGGLPLCTGENCVNWEVCNLQILESRQDIESAFNHPHQRHRERGGSRR